MPRRLCRDEMLVPTQSDRVGCPAGPNGLRTISHDNQRAERQALLFAPQVLLLYASSTSAITASVVGHRPAPRPMAESPRLLTSSSRVAIVQSPVRRSAYAGRPKKGSERALPICTVPLSAGCPELAFEWCYRLSTAQGWRGSGEVMRARTDTNQEIEHLWSVDIRADRSPHPLESRGFVSIRCNTSRV